MIRALLAALVVVIAGACGGGEGDSPPSVCGNGTVEAGEDCDDGNAVAGDGCEATCLFSCVADANCDDGQTCTIDTCSATLGCLHEPNHGACGDGIECTTDTCDPLVSGADPSTGCVNSPVHSACDDGDACTSDTCNPANGCVNAALTTWYEDSDRDGFGNAVVSACAADAPAGFVANATDCCDTSAATFPGQTTYFTSANTCGKYDYNCNGVAELGSVGLGTACSGGASCSGRQGFLGTVPSCGQTGTYLVGCYTQSCGVFCTSCLSSTIATTQMCR